MNIAQMMQKAQVMKQKMAEMQEKVSQMEVSGEAGAGMVKVVSTGKGELRSLKLDPSIVDASEIDVLEDLVIAAVNDARNKGEAMMAEETQKMMSELGLPPGLDLPF